MDLQVDGFDAVLSQGRTKMTLSITLTTIDGLCAINTKKFSVNFNCVYARSAITALRMLADMIDKHHAEKKRLFALYGRNRKVIQRKLEELNQIQTIKDHQKVVICTCGGSNNNCFKCNGLGQYYE